MFENDEVSGAIQETIGNRGRIGSVVIFKLQLSAERPKSSRTHHDGRPQYCKAGMYPCADNSTARMQQKNQSRNRAHSDIENFIVL